MRPRFDGKRIPLSHEPPSTRYRKSFFIGTRPNGRRRRGYYRHAGIYGIATDETMIEDGGISVKNLSSSSMASYRDLCSIQVPMEEHRRRLSYRP